MKFTEISLFSDIHKFQLHIGKQKGLSAIRKWADQFPDICMLLISVLNK